MNVDFFLDRVFSTVFRCFVHMLRSNCSVHDGGCAYTHLLHTHFFCCTVCLRTSAHLHACEHTRMAQVHEKGVRCMCACLSLSRLLPSHVSPVSAVPVHPLRLLHSVHNLAVLSPKSAGHAPLRTCIEKFGYLTKSHANTTVAIRSG